MGAQDRPRGRGRRGRGGLLREHARRPGFVFDDVATAEYERALAIESRNWNAELKVGNARLAAGNPEAAIESYRACWRSSRATRRR